MNDPGYELTIEPKENLLKIVAWGMWTIELVERFELDVIEAQTQMKRQVTGSTERKVLVDAREQGVQHQDVAARLQLAVSTVGTSTRKAAVVVQSALFKLQSKRVHRDANVRFFSSDEEARQWLMSP